MKHISRELAAVLHIFSHDEELRAKALPHINMENQSINWGAIFANYFDSSHYGAVLWAYSIWRDEPGPRNPFDAAFAMDAGLRRTALRALAIRWCISIDNIRGLRVA